MTKLFVQFQKQQQQQQENALQKQFEASLKKDQSALKLARKAESEYHKNIQSKLARALLGQNAEAASHKAAEDPLVTKLKNMSKQSSESASGVEDSSESNDGKPFRQ